MTTHIVNISGGKDSTALYLLALARGKPFRPIMLDTDNEHPLTAEYAKRLGERTGGPDVEIYRADFTDRIAAKARYVREKWPEKGVPPETVERAIAFLKPTGNIFLDLCIWKGRFPSRKAQFCTSELKSIPAWDQVVAPALATGPVVQWIGVRRDESRNRANAPFVQRVRHEGLHPYTMFRPLIHWTAENVFAFSRAHGLDPNPLYMQGMRRVGCFPCINCSKSELRQIGMRFPEAVQKIREWEDIVAAASKHQAATFFAADATPEGAALAARLKAQNATFEESGAAPWPRADEVFEWAKTGRGGRNYSLDNWLEEQEDGGLCSSEYGLCE
ncbi:MAG TPA: phosphoadenosine phosphosulfate reductase family protein [Micropruina sp.]|nr:phosphoadenosine phosphosulfate reductase family protein [Micropruina sp.]